MKDRTIYRITLRPEYDCTDDEVIRALRWLLKRSLRQYGLRCIEIEKETHGNDKETTQ